MCKRMMHAIFSFWVVYSLLCAGLYVFQRKLMYLPSKQIGTPDTYGITGMQEHMIESDDGTLIQLWYRPAESGMPTIYYLHGNAGHIGDRAGILSSLANKGLGIAAINYRGYGKSEGTPDELGIYQDARAGLRWLLAQEIPLHDIAYYGESLGTGVAIKLASESSPKALFLQAPYTSVVNRAAEIYWYVPVRLLLKDHFDSLSRIGGVSTPLTVFHGELDGVIPVEHGKTLLEAANEPKKGIFFPQVEHNDFDSSIISQHVLERLRAF